MGKRSMIAEQAHVTQCIRCTDTFVMVGTTPIRLGQRREGRIGRVGTCPKHRNVQDYGGVMR